MSDHLIAFSPDLFCAPVLVCDSDGCIAGANAAGRVVAGHYFGKHVARLSDELGRALMGFRLQQEQAEDCVVGLSGGRYRVQLLPAGNAGVAILLLEMVRDKAADRALKLFKAAFENAADGIWVADSDAVICAVNKASERLNGVRPRQVVGRSIRDVLAEGLMDRSVTVEVLKRGRQVSFVQHIMTTDKHLHVTGTPHYDEHGDIEFVVVVERDMTDLRHMRSSVEASRMARDKARELLTEMSLQKEGGSGLVAESPRMKVVADMALKLARLEAQCILITGETGSGKHTLGRYVHRHGLRQDGPFMNVNCAALPPSLQDAELFGYERGAVPGISGKAKTGMLALAEKGTLMLDDVGTLSPQTQARLLRCLVDGEYMPLGSHTARRLDCSLLVTASDELKGLVARGLFREDLYRRMNMFSLNVPPLRERPGDLPDLAGIFLERANHSLGSQLALTPQCLALLERHDFPGNTHDLEALIMKAAALGEDGDLASALEELLDVSPGPLVRGSQAVTLRERLEDVERDTLSRARMLCRTTREMGETLGISQASVVRKLRKHGLASPEK